MPSTSPGLSPDVADGRGHGLAGQGELRAARVLRVLGLPDADDGGCVLEGAGHALGSRRQDQLHRAGDVVAP